MSSTRHGTWIGNYLLFYRLPSTRNSLRLVVSAHKLTQRHFTSSPNNVCLSLTIIERTETVHCRVLIKCPSIRESPLSHIVVKFYYPTDCETTNLTLYLYQFQHVIFIPFCNSSSTFAAVSTDKTIWPECVAGEVRAGDKYNNNLDDETIRALCSECSD